MTAFRRPRKRGPLAVAVAVTFVLGHPARVLGQTLEFQPGGQRTSLTAQIERAAARLAESSAAAGQFGQPGQPTIGGPNCTKRKGALIGAILGATTTAIVLLQAESNRRSGQTGFGAGTVVLILGIGAAGGALAGAAACQR